MELERFWSQERKREKMSGGQQLKNSIELINSVARNIKETPQITHNRKLERTNELS
jgi:hypothetical protein